VDGFAVQQHLPAPRRNQPRYRSEEGGLAAGIGADDHGDLAGGNRQVEAMEDFGIVVAGREADGDEQMIGHGVPPIRLTRMIR
jgi:hypothetical protein